MNIAEILLYKFPDIDLFNQVIVQDDGQGPYIAKWNLEEPKPDNETLKSWEQEAIEIKRKKENNDPLLKQLEELDIKSIRALRANEVERLAELEQQAIALRGQLI